MFVCSQLQHIYSAVFLLLVTAASDLLVHKILLNSVLPIVSYCLRRCLTKPPGQTPLSHNPLFSAIRGSVGVRTPNRGSNRVRSTGSVSFQQKYPLGSVLRCPTPAENGIMTKGVVSRGGTEL